MPQLNPAPWLLIFLLTWTTLITIFLPKTFTLTQTTNPSTTSIDMDIKQPWTWPWL
uniref:ATP synthase complex subunit 8 n=1 Tax=Rhineura floridana TaxID=261503 RepID=Q66SZ2_RHIFL|nr:ATP synthase F0 subunit 8 [Rhineura floridana]AAT08494.1 ATP synthase F0 subunit 8 [Rhineura floridana]